AVGAAGWGLSMWKASSEQRARIDQITAAFRELIPALWEMPSTENPQLDEQLSRALRTAGAYDPAAILAGTGVAHWPFYPKLEGEARARAVAALTERFGREFLDLATAD